MELQGAMKTVSLRIVVLLYFTFSVAASTEMFLEPGVFDIQVSLPFTPSDSEIPEAFEYLMMQKSMYANSEIGVEVLNCSSDPEGCSFTLEWTVRQSDCDGVYRPLFVDLNKTSRTKSLDGLYKRPDCFLLSEEHTISFVKSVDVPNPVLLCSENGGDTHDKLNDLKGDYWNCSSKSNTSKVCNKLPFCTLQAEDKKSSADATKPVDSSTKGENAEPPKREKRAEVGDPEGVNPGDEGKVVTTPVAKEADKGQGDTDNANEGDKDQGKVTAIAANNTLLKSRVVHTTQKDGRFLFIINVTSLSAKQINISLRIRMKSPHGYLSATQYPLLPFYGVMCAMYSILGLIWIVLLFRQWRDLLRIQFWISVVIILGLIEKAAFVAEYERHNNSGSNTSAGLFFAEELSVLKRTMARMLVIVVSLGYGITRPRLGRDLNWLIGAGVLFFLLSSVEAYFRVFEPHKSNDLIALLPISVLDAVLCWWIFRSLVDTSRTLRLRRNLVKLWLYRHFTNALIFCVVAAVVFLVWSLKAHRINTCVKNWNEIWVDDAYWHILFCVILVVIMILFRPTANNQRYAYSILSDAVEEDESKEPMMNDAFESVKMRNVHSNRSSNQPKEVDDLQWVEDNIPAAVADAALGAFDDSEEELITNVERNKME
ncbi:transmembrane protein 87A isoform X2 [Strongylocentrotus purpuratus]|uniref:GOST seven transmembrane domain-containing protein n=1 Tax=Strongylocentrotus purpuratus TaxID=7668 RepID=A0A7M7PMS9_STRPU|nr:transmembrane protein 87A isoform X2 [Strongylocentrotus purpuratus]